MLILSRISFLLFTCAVTAFSTIASYAETISLVKGQRLELSGSEDLNSEFTIELQYDSAKSARIQFLAYDAKASGNFISYFESSKKSIPFQYGDLISENTKLLNVLVTAKKGESIENLKMSLYKSSGDKKELIAEYAPDTTGNVISLGDFYQYISNGTAVWKFAANALSVENVESVLKGKGLATYLAPDEFEDTAYGQRLADKAEVKTPQKTGGIILTKKKETLERLKKTGNINLSESAGISLEKLGGMGLADSDAEVSAVFDVTGSASGLYPGIMQKVMEMVLGTACAIDSDNKFDAYVFGNGAKGIGCITLDSFPGYAGKAWGAGRSMRNDTRYSDALKLIHDEIFEDRKLNPYKPIKPTSLLVFTDGHDNSSNTAAWAEKLAKLGVYINIVIVNDRYKEKTRYKKVKTGKQIEVKTGGWFNSKKELRDEYESKRVVEQEQNFTALERLQEIAKGFFLRNVTLSFIPVSKVKDLTQEEVVDLIINDDYRDFVKSGTDKGFWMKTPAQL